MKNRVNQFFKITTLALSLFFINGCGDDNDDFFLTIIATHSDYDSIESTFATLTVLIDEEFFDEDTTLTSSSSSGTSLIPEEGHDANQNISTGSSVTTTYRFSSPKEKIDLKLKVNNAKTIEVNDIANNSTIEWDFKDNYATINSPNDGGDNDGDDDESCKDWNYYDTECLSNVADGNGSSEPGMRARACRISETDTEITVRTEIEAINGGIDNINAYEGIDVYYGDGSVIFISKEDFNAQGVIIKEYTATKSSINNTESDWDKIGLGYYIVVRKKLLP